jgi:hypothetical protein
VCLLSSECANSDCPVSLREWRRIVCLFDSLGLIQLRLTVKPVSSLTYPVKCIRVNDFLHPICSFIQQVTVITSSPQLPTMAILVDDLNEDHDLYTFIRKVHEAYEMMVSIFFYIAQSLYFSCLLSS